MAVLAWLVFWGLFVPVALVLRLARIDPLCRKYELRAKTYWLESRPESPEAMTRQT